MRIFGKHIDFSSLDIFEKIIYSVVFSGFILWIFYILHQLSGSNIHQIWLFFALPGSFEEFIKQPWSLVTYAWIHLNIIGFFFNLIWLWFIGRIFLGFEPNGKMFKIFILGIIAGGLGFLLAYSFLPFFFRDEPNAYLTGISTGYLSWLGYLTAKYSNYPVYVRLLGNIKIKWFFYFFIFWDVIQFPLINSGGHIAHLFALFTGYFAAKFMNSRKMKPKHDFHIYDNYKTSTEKKIDRILDKINKKGMRSLTDEERSFLERESKR